LLGAHQRTPPPRRPALRPQVIQSLSVKITTSSDKVSTKIKYTVDHTKVMFGRDVGAVNAWGLVQLEDDDGNHKGNETPAPFASFHALLLLFLLSEEIPAF
jgi:hypothetical protein